MSLSSESVISPAQNMVAIILAGGQAKRLGGVSKPGLRYRGSSLLDRVASAAADQGASAVVVVGDRQRLEPTLRSEVGEVRWAREQPALSGPVPALAAGLAALGWGSVNQDDGAPAWVLLLAADLPAPEAGVRLLASSIDSADPGEDGALLVDPDGREQYLFGAYRRHALVSALAVEPALTRLSEVIAKLKIRAIPAEEATVRDLDTSADAQWWGVEL